MVVVAFAPAALFVGMHSAGLRPDTRRPRKRCCSAAWRSAFSDWPESSTFIGVGYRSGGPDPSRVPKRETRPGAASDQPSLVLPVTGGRGQEVRLCRKTTDRSATPTSTRFAGSDLQCTGLNQPSRISWAVPCASFLRHCLERVTDVPGLIRPPVITMVGWRP